MDVSAWGMHAATKPLEPLTVARRDTGAKDVEIDILYCGVCHTDIHFGHDDWGMTVYPIVPGHEIVGRVVGAGAEASDFAPDDLVAVGCFVDSCRTCSACQEGLEQYCEAMPVFTYNGTDPVIGGQTYGGYSTKIVVDKDFVLRVPENLDTKAVAPLLCAGITTYSPMRQWGVKKGDKVGIIGLGGLGHMGVKIAAGMGAEVTLITRSADKAKDAERLGANHVLLSGDSGAMEAAAGSFDFLLNTIPVSHDLNPYLPLLKRDKTMVIVGAVDPVEPVMGANLIFQRKRIAGSLVGGLAETQEMLDFCAEHGIVSDVEMIGISEINEAWKRVQAADVQYRFVIDMASLKDAA